MNLKELFIQLDNKLKDNEVLLKDCIPILDKYDEFDYLFSITKKEIDKLFDDDINYIRIPVTSTEKYNPQHFDPYLLIWSKNNFSPIHDHPERGCILKVLKGSIKEIRYSNPELKEIQTSVLNEGDTSYIHDIEGFHKVKNNNQEKLSISLHIYSPKGYKVNYLQS